MRLGAAKAGGWVIWLTYETWLSGRKIWEREWCLSIHCSPPYRCCRRKRVPILPRAGVFLNPLYLRIEEIPGAAALGDDLQRLATLGRALNEERSIDRDRVFFLKQEALQLLWPRFVKDPAFERFRIAEGRSLHEFSVFCALAEEHGGNWRQWPSAYRRADSPDVERFAHSHTDRVNFHTWLQWQMNQQFTHASKSVSLMQDLPIGFSPDGADAWVWQDLIASNMRVGAPLDLYNTEGQDWGLPPFIPHRLRTAEYEPFIQTIRAGMCHAGGLRIDHVWDYFDYGGCLKRGARRTAPMCGIL